MYLENTEGYDDMLLKRIIFSFEQQLARKRSKIKYALRANHLFYYSGFEYYLPLGILCKNCNLLPRFYNNL